MYNLEQKILVTGGCGFIGSHVCYTLLKKGFSVVCVDSNFNSTPKVIDQIIRLLEIEGYDVSSNFEFFKGDIRDKIFLKNIFLKSKENHSPISAVIHLAGLKSVSESVSKPLQYWDCNVIGSINLFQVMQENNCKTIVFSSSATIYGSKDDSPIKENAKIQPSNPYGYTKSSIEQILSTLFGKQNCLWKIANLRYFNPIGCHPSGQFGEDPKDIPNNLFPLILEVASGKRSELKIFGNDWPTYDGTGVRDFIHVMDLAECHLQALIYLMKTKSEELISVNVGTGKGTSVMELIKTFERVNDCKIPFEICDRRDGDISTSIADNNLCKAKLSWSTKRTVDDMCRDGWKWKLNYPDGLG